MTPFPLSPDAGKLAESRENIAKMQAEQAIAKTEFVIEKDALTSKVTEATTYQLREEDLANLANSSEQNVVKFNKNNPEGDNDEPKPAQERVAEDFGTEINMLELCKTPEKEESYHKLFNDPRLRAKYLSYREKYQAEIDVKKNNNIET